MFNTIAIVGPTASGKTALALELAESLDGEIISVDSRKVYQYMDIGTAKPGKEITRRIRHHLIDIIEPSERMDARRFLELAEAAAHDIRGRGKRPIFCGGTGLYLDCFISGLFPAPPADPAFRKDLAAKIAELGSAHFHARLAILDPAWAGRIHPNDEYRIIRGLEIIELSGRLPSSLAKANVRPRVGLRVFGVELGRPETIRRIDERIDRMIDEGLLDEIRGILSRGYDFDSFGLNCLGYREFRPLFESGEAEPASCVSDLKVHTRQFAKRQITWFRKRKYVRWMNSREIAKEILNHSDEYFT